MSNLNAASLYENLQQPISQYYDKSSNLTREEYFYKLSISTTLYLGNLSIYTTEEQIFELFNRVGAGVRRLIMGRNKETGKAIGFCFIEYFNHEDAKEAHEYLDLLKLDERAIRVDWDIGYSEGREYGRGTGGRQQIQKDLMFNQIEAEEGVIIIMEEEEYKQMMMRVIIQEVDIRKEEEIDQIIIIEE
ncbi:unnamed protein product [Paramecium pentaurelia]|uniref:Nuclear cap-binding protein subunit 2 n=1 Tax=Paramecium pentaurelia TaxID=43138 RepID=A0A8S1WRW9_9CILI|nr:unnamed protein product [Paramecium pentaurelia]